MDAIALLKSDHQTVKALLEELNDTSNRATKRRVTLIEKISLNLHAHTTIEEEIFYPAFRKAGSKEQQKLYFEALEEHRAAEQLVLPDLLKTAPDSDKFSGRAKVLKELIEHHVEEEESEMFKQAQKLLNKAELRELGERMAKRRKELLAGGR